VKIDRTQVLAIQRATQGADLHRYLQSAIELEHSTIPPYLTALLSLKRGTNQAIAQRLGLVMGLEMLHMAIASNILISIGGRPAINTPGFIPTYPGPLPMDIGDLRVGIEGFSKALVHDVFMAIETPEEKVPVNTAAALDEDEYATIGDFYDAIKERIVGLGESIFVRPDAPPQVVNSKWFPQDQLFAITGVESACRAIDLIKLQGEGTPRDPFEAPGTPAHFYIFGEIYAGRELEQTATGFAYSGAPIPFDPDGVFPLKPNCKIADFAVGTQARTRIEQFAYDYSTLLNALHDAFNGAPERLDAAIAVMFDLKLVAVALLQTPAGDGLNVGPSYEYVGTQGGMP
jgi:Ferritin-like